MCIRDRYKHIVFGVIATYYFAGEKTIYRAQVGSGCRKMFSVLVDCYDDVMGVDMSDVMQDFANQYNGNLVKDYDSNGNVVKGSVRIEFN